MALTDSPHLRALIEKFFPGFQFEAVLRPSGQRLVYFCRFGGTQRREIDGTLVTARHDWESWGPVVLKISSDMSPTNVARLEKERELLQGLNSPYFPQLKYCDYLTRDPETEEKLDTGLFVTIEERIPGQSLAECKHHFTTERAALSLISHIVAGLKLLWEHPQHLVHRDLKPDNILIRPDGSPVIIDLGIIREEGSIGLTVSAMDFGPCSPPYASPEQILNQKKSIDKRADFYALGVLLYELLSGVNPFCNSPHESREIVMQRVLQESPPSLPSLRCAGDRCSALVESLMAKQPYQRPRTIAILEQSLRAAQDGA